MKAMEFLEDLTDLAFQVLLFQSQEMKTVTNFHLSSGG